MKRKKQGYKLVMLGLVLTLGMLAGCSGQEAAPESEVMKPLTETQEDSSGAMQGEGREITDMAGRIMTIPDEIETVFSVSPISGIYLYTLAPDMLLGWNYALNEVERSVILEKYHDLPDFGMGDAINYEAVIAAGPSIAFNVSDLASGVALSDKLAESLGIPVVMVSADLEDAPEVYRFMGALLGMEAQAEKLAIYAENTFRDIAETTIPEEEKVRVYYGNGEDSLETAPAGASSAQVIEMVNAINVADLELGDGSRIKISLEQLLAWDPDVIIVNGEPKSDISGGTAAESIMNNPDFATIKAVQNNRVFGGPNAPFSWIERPPGPNRIVGMRWLAKKLYPDYFDYDVDEEVRAFFQLFYHTELTDEKLAEVYNGY